MNMDEDERRKVAVDAFLGAVGSSSIERIVAEDRRKEALAKAHRKACDNAFQQLQKLQHREQWAQRQRRQQQWEQRQEHAAQVQKLQQHKLWVTQELERHRQAKEK